MATPTVSALTTLLAQRRQELARLQEDIAAIERTIAVLQGRRATPAAAPRALAITPPGPPPGHPSLRTLVLDLLKASATPLTPAALRARLAARGRQCHRRSLTACLATLRRQGRIRRTGPGLYQAVSGAAATPPSPTAPRPAAGSATRPPTSARSQPRRREVRRAASPGLSRRTTPPPRRGPAPTAAG